MLAYELVRSRRKTLAIEVTREGRVLVRAPQRLPKPAIDRFVAEKHDWIAEKLTQQQLLRLRHPEPAPEEVEALRQDAGRILPDRVLYYSHRMKLYPTSIKITAARKRFGSCSGKNGLCFSLYLMQYPMDAIDYVVVHELAHIRYKNHQKEFYALVEEFLPDWKRRRQLLRQ